MRAVLVNFAPRQLARARARRRHVESQRIGLARGDPPRGFVHGNLAPLPGIQRRAVGIARPECAACFARRNKTGDLRPAFERRIDQAVTLKLRQRRAITVEVFRLPQYRLFPRNAEPGEVFIDRGFIFRAAARSVDILDAQQHAPTHGLRHLEIHQRRQRMTEMEVAIRRRRETENGLRHAVLFCKRGKAIEGYLSYMFGVKRPSPGSGSRRSPGSQ